MSVIAVLGALDTKGEEFRYLIGCIRRRGHEPLVVDTSVIKDPGFTPDVGADRIAERGGSRLEALRERADRGEAMQVMARGAEAVILALFKEGRIDGIIGMGGSGGTSVFAAGVQSLPVGFPKLLITTLASGNTRSIVGTKDLLLFPAVVDIAGLNRISRRILANAAGAICGMVEAQAGESNDEKPLIAATMLGNTTEAVDAARQIFEKAGYEVLVFHAIGSGGMTMESLIADGLFAGVFDFTLTELASELAGSPMSAGASRLQAAGGTGIPLVIVPGCTDFSIFRQPETIPERYARRHFYSWNLEATLMRTTPQESALLGAQIAERANAACGPVAVLLPLRGLSLLDVEGQPYWWPEADAALFGAIREGLRPDIPLIEMELQINDPAFARRAAETLLELIANINRLPKSGGCGKTSHPLKTSEVCDTQNRSHIKIGVAMNAQDAVGLARSYFLTEDNLYGCAETTFMTLKEVYGLPEASDSSAAMALNGGVAYSGGICGALSGAAMAVGMLAVTRISDHRGAKRAARRIIGRFAEEFRAAYGSVDCRDLIELDIQDEAQHRAFIKSDIWRTRCMGQIEYAVRKLAVLSDEDEWEQMLREQEPTI